MNSLLGRIKVLETQRRVQMNSSKPIKRRYSSTRKSK